MIAKIPLLLRHFRRTVWFACIFSAVSAYATQVAAPTFSPVAGTYASAQSVTISTTTGGATIIYTTDGSTPTESGGSITNGTLYSSAVTISGTTRLNAIAYEAGFTDSTVTSGLYTIISSPAASLNILYNFNAANNGGIDPPAGLVLASDGNFYGTTYHGGSSNDGTVFKLTSTGVLTSLVTFTGTANGANPNASLVQGSDGNFYGTTLNGGSNSDGTIFQMTPTGTLTTLVSFNGTNGEAPGSALVQGSDGNFYGTTFYGGNSNDGTVFKMTPAGVLTTLVSFTGTNGANPNTALVQGSDGNFYGTTYGLQVGTYGTVFKMTPAGVLTTLVSFNSTNGSDPQAPLVQGTDGNFYGTTSAGGSNSKGTVFEMTPAGILTTLVSFNGTNGNGPFAALLQGSDGNFYGTTTAGGSSSDGTVFKMTPAGTLTTLASFNGANGNNPFGALVQGTDGNFYSTTAAGGSNGGGSVFQLTVPLVAAPTFSPAAGTYTSAQSVTISTTTGGATIRYTTDGSTPTETNGTVYTSAVSISSSTMLKAVAYETGFTDSAVASGLYTITNSPAATLNVIYDFTVYTDPGLGRLGGLVQGTDGNFYSTTAAGGSNGGGSVFQLTPTGVLTTLVSFSNTDGQYPLASLIQGSDGNFYGTTFEGGSSYSYPSDLGHGVIFKMTPAGVLTALVSFAGSNGANPTSSLVQGSDGNFYGTTLNGGSNSDGTVFQMTPTGVLTTLVSFNGTNGTSPDTALVQGSDGNFYGTTLNGGSNSDGTVFQMTPTGVLTTLVSFNGTNGTGPDTALVQSSDGNFYGTTRQGGSSNDGTIFKMTPAGVLTTLVSFNSTNGQSPKGLVQGSDGNFYGTTSNGGSNSDGTIFKMTPAGILTTLVSFNGPNGAHPLTGLVQGSDGNFYGRSDSGGSSNIAGVIFQLIVPTTVAPVFSPAAGTYTSAQSVTLTSATGGASIAYTTDGTTPTESGGSVTHGTLYSGAISITGTTTINAIAFEVGLADSAVTPAIYNINIPGVTSAPIFSPGGGTYIGAQSVTLTSATSGASIAYTTDGTTPTESSGSVTHGTLLSNGGSVSIGASATLKAIAFKIGQTDSTVATGAYTIQAATPTFSPAAGTYASAQSVTINTATSGASIAYTTDGTTPTESGGSVTHGTLYSGAISITTNTTLNAIAFETGLTDSTVATATYAIQAATPTFSPVAGFYTSAQSVTINSTTSGAAIAYTTDGTTPTESGGSVTHGTLYSGAISITGTTTLNAIAFKTGLTDSTVASSTYSFQVATPTFSLSPGGFTSIQSVTISAAPSGASIVYTTDGTTPTESGGTVTHGTLYSGPITVSTTTTLNAIAFKSGLADSNVGVTSIIVHLPLAATPNFSPGGGTYTSVQSVTLTSATSGASFVYTTDGSLPTESGGTVTHGTLYTGPITIDRSLTLSAIAFAYGYLDSGVPLVGYTINIAPTTPTFNPSAGTYGTTQSVTISSIGNSTIRYTTDGSTPTETNGTVYSGPVSISSSKILKAIAYETGYPDTAVTSGIYNITSSPAAILNVIYNFTSLSGNGGFHPYAGLVQGTDGNFYGTANEGGSNNDGTIFKITSTGSLTALTSFTGSNGAFPFAGLVQSTDGNFYGTTNTSLSAPSLNNPGTVFKMTPAGSLTTLVTFSSANGIFPFAGLIQGTDGNFYGTTFEAGSGSYGTVFKMTPAGGLTTLVSFAGANGGLPNANLVQGSDGNFYGMTYEGGSTYVSANNLGEGTIFKMTPSGVLTTLVSFTGANGSFPAANLVQGNDGNFYGTTTGDNVNNDGTVFKMTPAGVLTTLAYFSSTSGQFPNGLVQGSDGNFYGTTEGTDSGGSYGTVFKITPAGVLTTLASFDSANGNEPLAGLVQGTDGNFYGTTVLGGISSVGVGVVFQLIVPSGTAAPVFSPAPGTYTGAQTVTITSATSGASIRYTTNGSTPTETTGTLYSGPMSISSTTTLNAIAFKSGMADSAVVTPAYTIQSATSSSSGSTSSSPASSGGGGGGGAFDDWFLGFLAFAGLWRALTRANHKRQ
jgi:uncharacterized repeat protein (TIGR03803 family)